MTDKKIKRWRRIGAKEWVDGEGYELSTRWPLGYSIKIVRVE